MKKIVMVLLVSLFTVSGVFAQQRPKKERLKPEDLAKRQTELLTKELGLTEEQKEKIYEINLKFAQPTEQEKADRAEREKRREEFKKRHQDKTESINALLTDDQKAKFEKHQKDRQNKKPRGNRPRK